MGSGTVTPVSTATNTPGAAITVRGAPYGIPYAVAISPDGKTAYVADFGSNSVTPISTATNAPGAAITVGANPSGVAVTPDGQAAYVANSSSNTVTPISTTTNRSGDADHRWRKPQCGRDHPRSAADGSVLAGGGAGRFAVQLRRVGVGDGKVKGRCATQTTKNRKHRPCRLRVTWGTLSRPAHGGRNVVSFQGRISANKKLEPGRYMVVIVARAAGKTSASKALTFTISR